MAPIQKVCFLDIFLSRQLYQELREAEFFKRTRSQLIYFDLLYDKEEFGQIIADAKLHIDLIHERGQKLSRAICLQMFAACYKEVDESSAHLLEISYLFT